MSSFFFSFFLRRGCPKLDSKQQIWVDRILASPSFQRMRFGWPSVLSSLILSFRSTWVITFLRTKFFRIAGGSEKKPVSVFDKAIHKSLARVESKKTQAHKLVNQLEGSAATKALASKTSASKSSKYVQVSILKNKWARNGVRSRENNDWRFIMIHLCWIMTCEHILSFNLRLNQLPRRPFLDWTDLNHCFKNHCASEDETPTVCALFSLC